MLKIMTVEEVNTSRRVWAQTQLHIALDAVQSAAGVMELLGAGERASALMRIGRNIKNIHDSV